MRATIVLPVAAVLLLAGSSGVLPGFGGLGFGGLGFGGLGFGGACGCWAQDVPTGAVFLPSDGDRELLLREVEETLARSDWDGVVEGLTRFAEWVTVPPTNAVVASGGGMAPGIETLFQRIASKLPATALQRYRGRLDALVQAAWDDASLVGGETLRRLRRRIIRDYPQSSLYSEALEVETDYAAESGYWPTVQELLERWLEDFGSLENADIQREIQARLLLLTALRATEDAAGVLRERKALQGLLGASSSPIEGRIADTLRRELDEPPAEVSTKPRVTDTFQLGASVWESEDLEGRTAEFLNERAQSAPNEIAPIPFFPVVRQDIVALQHSGRLVALNWKDAKEMWSVDTGVEHYHPDQVLIPLLGDDLCVYVRGSAMIALDASTGATRWGVRFEYDGQAKKLRATDLSSAPQPVVPERVRESETQAAPTVVVAPPTYFEGQVVTGVDVRLASERLLYFVSMEPSGRVHWITFLGSSQSEDYLSLGGLGSLPLVRGSSIFYLTNFGILAAFDGVDGTILWETEYPRLGSRGVREAIRTEDRWQRNPLILAGEELLAAPQDSASLLGIDPATGVVRWRCSRGAGIALLGADDHACYCAGSSILAISHTGPNRGRILWEVVPDFRAAAGGPSWTGQETDARLGRGFPMYGRGLLVEDRLLVPSSDALYTIDTSSGRVLDAVLWEFGIGAGNLARCGPHLSVIGANGFSLYSTRDTELARLESLPAEGPESRLEHAKFYLRNLEIEKGLENLLAWRKLSPAPPTPNSRLDHLHLDLAELLRTLGDREVASDATTQGEMLHLRVLLERIPQRKVDAAIRYGEHLERQGLQDRAIIAFHEALSLDNPETDYSPRPFATLKSRAFIRERIRRLRASYEGSVQTVDEAAMALLQAARKKNRPPAFTEILRRYPYTLAAAAAYLELARLYEERQDDRHAIDALAAFLEDFPNHPDTVRSSLRLAELHLQAGDVKAARSLYGRLTTVNENALDRGTELARPGETVAAFARRQVAGLRPPPEQSDSLRFPIRMAWRSPADLQAVSRAFLWPTGIAPAEFQDCFLTQSVEVIELREEKTGLPRWRTHLELIPGFQFSKTSLGFHLPRTGSSMLQAHHVGSVLILNDDRNLFAVEAATGRVKWHVPVGPEGDDGAERGGLLRQLRERLRGVLICDSGVFRTSSGSRGETSRRYLARVSVDDGETDWEVELDYEPDVFPPAIHDDKLYVLARRPLGIHTHEASTGRHVGVRTLGSPLRWSPIVTSEGHWILPTSSELLCLDLARERLLWKIGDPSSRIEAVDYSEIYPKECTVVIKTAGEPARVASIDIERGSERWSYGGLPENHNSFSITRSGPDVYVVHGESRLSGTGSWLLLGLRTVPGPQGPSLVPLWQDPVELESLIGISTRHNLHVSQDSLLLAEPTGSISIYDKDLGVRKSALATPISQFLTEKGSFESALLDGRLLLLTDSGDCAYESFPNPALVEDFSQTVFVRAILDDPDSAETALPLAEYYFREGDIDRAIDVLDHLLQSEVVMTAASSRLRFQAGYLLDGLREEKMKRTVPTIVCPAMPRPPAIDGKLDDPWHVGTRIRLVSPENVGKIPSGDQRQLWEGTEDLSAVLYTGWDATYFYAALDVTDDVLHPYDRDAENWTGDCLIIGVDPTGDGGYRQHGNDQLMTLALTVPRRNKLDKEQEKDKDKGENKDDPEKDEEDRKPEGLFSVKKKDDDSGAVYEIALPWATFSEKFTQGTSPNPGFDFGLSLLLTDDDTGQGATKTISLNPCQLLPKSQKSSWVWRFIIPYYFPRVILE